MNRLMAIIVMCPVLVGYVDATIEQRVNEKPNSVFNTTSETLPSERRVYTSCFEQGIIDGWTRFGDHRICISSSIKPDEGEPEFHFLGEYFRDTVQISDDKLPKHQLLVIEYDLLILKTWAGDGRRDASGRQTNSNAPDRFTVQLDDGRVLTDATFSNDTKKGAAPWLHLLSASHFRII